MSEDYDYPRADGAPRMNAAQRDALWDLCGRYDVPFREDDYLIISAGSLSTPGHVEGWVGGNKHNGKHEKQIRGMTVNKKTIYVGVDTDGRINS
jgi:hypothetical protein